MESHERTQDSTLAGVRETGNTCRGLTNEVSFMPTPRSFKHNPRSKTAQLYESNRVRQSHSKNNMHYRMLERLNVVMVPRLRKSWKGNTLLQLS